ncbi:hypothetical protein [Agaribacter flavus]|uniref:Uncharacterized protein n=1 Tax=Agaribacter flavus TaxID=1902781 RepID=A0ABV7FM18_9ALTE
MLFRVCKYLCFLCCIVGAVSYAENLELTEEHLQRIGDKIYKNETGGNEKYLIAWNAGESFASLGLGHFIWFPEGLQSPFTETFPALVEYLHAQGVALPMWLLKTKDAPWGSKDLFLQAQDSQEMKDLRQLLRTSFPYQVKFIHKRMQQSLPLILSTLKNPASQQVVKRRFLSLAETELGMYALIDYVNFKGEGVSAKERYQGQGWGLLQVLLGMDAKSKDLNQAFSESCKRVLTKRVENSPQQATEEKWLAGWIKRCNTYK